MKPILFNTEMVRDMLDGRKSVTRRLVKPRPLWRARPVQQEEYPEYWGNWDDEKLYKAPYRPGDILYVRETWTESKDGYAYKADEPGSDGWGWRPSIHMPKKAARLFLRVKDVRVERLWDITYDKAIAEGAKSENNFIWIWNNTIKKADIPLYGWAANPWVWVIEFERISREEAMKGGGGG